METKQPSKVLLVDDEPNILTAIEFLLERKGFTIAKAFNGIQALEVLEEFQPNVVVLDVMMPGLDGFEVAKKIRSSEKFHEVSIIFLTAKGTSSDRWEGYASGGEFYITKPFDNQHLVETITEISELKSIYK